MLRRGNEWSATVAPCITAGYAQIEAAVAAGTIPADEKAGYASVLFFVASIDAAEALAEPLDAELAVAQQSYRQMRLNDPVLRAGAPRRRRTSSRRCAGCRTSTPVPWRRRGASSAFRRSRCR